MTKRVEDRGVGTVLAVLLQPKEGRPMYSEIWDVDVNHSGEVYVVQDEVGEEIEAQGDPAEELPYEIPRD